MTDSEKLDLLLQKMTSFESRMEGMESKMEGMESRMEGMESRMEGMESRMEHLESDMEAQKAEIGKINLTLENETNRNIQIIAEGHLDLSRKLNECIRLSSDIKAKQEIQDVFINFHTSKLRAL